MQQGREGGHGETGSRGHRGAKRRGLWDRSGCVHDSNDGRDFAFALLRRGRDRGLDRSRRTAVNTVANVS